jgi:hypothetical protein
MGKDYRFQTWQERKLVMNTENNVPETDFWQANRTRQCPYCSNIIPATEDPCHHCGHLEPADEAT